MDKYRYHLYPDRIYIVQIDQGVSIEIKGSELFNLLGLGSYMEEIEQ
jgi:hypothetical protein